MTISACNCNCCNKNKLSNGNLGMLFQPDYKQVQDWKDTKIDSLTKELSQMRGRGFVLGENYPDIVKLQEENDALREALKTLGESEFKQLDAVTKRQSLINKELKEEIRLLNADLKQQRFNNLHNLSIDQKISDEIQSLSDTLLEVDKNLNEEKISLGCIESTARMVRQTLRKLGYL